MAARVAGRRSRGRRRRAQAPLRRSWLVRNHFARRSRKGRTPSNGTEASAEGIDVVDASSERDATLVPHVIAFHDPALFIRDRTAVKSAFEKLAALPGLHRIVPFHGTIVESGAANALGTAAGSL